MIDKNLVVSSIYSSMLEELETSIQDKNPDEIFVEKPITFREFAVFPEHMNFPTLTERQFRVSDFMLGNDIYKMFDNKNTVAVLKWAKGSGKDNIAAMIILYIVYFLLCLKNPQKYFGLHDTDSIDLVNCAASGDQAANVFFEKFRQKILAWKWLNNKYGVRTSGAYIKQADLTSSDAIVLITKNGVVFPKLIRAFSGHSRETSVEGLNVLCLSGDTKLRLPNGTFPEIKNLVHRQNFDVFSYDLVTNRVVVGNCLKVIQTGVMPLLKFTVDGKASVLKCTGDHLVLLSDGAYKKASGLVVGDCVPIVYTWYKSTSDSMDTESFVRYRKIVGIENLPEEPVYDLVVEKYHNCVLQSGFVVHNCGILDEAAGFVEGTDLNNADKILNSLRSSAASRFGNRWKAFILSYPRYKDDIICRLYEISKRELHMYGDEGPTWEIKPRNMFSEKTFEFEGRQIPIDFEQEFKLNPEDAKCKYLCQPPDVVNSFVEYPEKINECIDYDKLPIINIRDISSDKVEKKIVDFNLPASQPNYIMTIDLGLKSDAAAMSIFHKEFDGEQEFIVQDFITAWEPEPSNGKVVSFLNIRDFIASLKNKVNIINILFDQWNSSYLIQELNNIGFNSEEYKLNFQDYKNFKERIYNKTIRLLNEPEQVKEIRQLQLLKNGKIDHPENLKKDRADTIVGAVKILDKTISYKNAGFMDGEYLTSNLEEHGEFID